MSDDDAIGMMRNVLEQYLAMTAPMSPRARAITAILRLCDRADVLDSDASDVVKTMTVLEIRDLARIVQSQIDDVFREAIVEPDPTDALQTLKIAFARLESATVLVMAWAGTEAPELTFWSGQVGARISAAIASAGAIVKLPEDATDPEPAAET